MGEEKRQALTALGASAEKQKETLDWYLDTSAAVKASLLVGDVRNLGFLSFFKLIPIDHWYRVLNSGEVRGQDISFPLQSVANNG